MTGSFRSPRRSPRRAVPVLAVVGLAAVLALGACGSPGSPSADEGASRTGPSILTPVPAGSTTTAATPSGPTTVAIDSGGPSTTTLPPPGPTTTTGGAIGPTVAPGDVSPPGPGRPTPPDATARAALAAARARWAAPAAYTFRVRFTCMCPMGGAWEVRVVDGVAVETTAVDPRPLSGSLPAGFRTVEELFAELDRALVWAEAVAATYDAALGYPVSVDIDNITQAIDDELSWRITSFVAG